MDCTWCWLSIGDKRGRDGSAQVPGSGSWATVPKMAETALGEAYVMRGPSQNLRKPSVRPDTGRGASPAGGGGPRTRARQREKIQGNEVYQSKWVCKGTW